MSARDSSMALGGCSWYKRSWGPSSSWWHTLHRSCCSNLSFFLAGLPLPHCFRFTPHLPGTSASRRSTITTGTFFKPNGFSVASHQGEPGLITSRITPGFSNLGIMQMMLLVRVFSLRSPVSSTPSFCRCSILTSLALKTLMSRATQITPLHSKTFSQRHLLVIHGCSSHVLGVDIRLCRESGL
ncbi:hypothetical protein PR048_024176 [Dryococelus australis]|uniref:Uncharacterized protein n=1 Tax=Dryococelus australis TaxID=614101 RepID=A0ABQ9GW58_9NEOP|nr:hypothetical protein PR048_024176 [Dryococelus australis]